MTGNLEQYGLPADMDCEKYVLGAVLKDFAKYMPQVVDIVSQEDFSIAKHQIVWRRVNELRMAGQPIDSVTVYKALATHGEADIAGGLSYLTSLGDGMPSIPNVGSYAASVREKATLRQAIIACQDSIEKLCDPRANGDDVITAERVLRAVAEKATVKRRLWSAAEIIAGSPDVSTPDQKAAAEFLTPSHGHLGIQTPWDGINAMTGGLKPGHLVILAARPSVGKTTAALQAAVLCAEMGQGVIYVSLEMPRHDLMRKLVAHRAGVSFQSWVRGDINREERRQIQLAAAQFHKLPLFFDDSGRVTVPGLHATVLRHMADHEVGLIVVDFLQLLTPSGRGDNRTSDVSEMTRGLKLLAMETNKPVLALSQLTRENERQNRPPKLSDLRESGSIEQDADEVMFLHRLDKPMVDMIVSKVRLGEIGKRSMVFNGLAGQFTEANTQ